MTLAGTPTPLPMLIRPASSFDSTSSSASCPRGIAALRRAMSSAEVYRLMMSENGRLLPAMRPLMPTTVPCTYCGANAAPAAREVI